MWRPILFKYCPVAYNQETRKLEIMKGKFVGKCKPTRHTPLNDLKCHDDDSDEDDDDDDDEWEEEEEGDNDDVDKDHGQVRDFVVADHIWQGLCLT